jgi:hypothetical protein
MGPSEWRGVYERVYGRVYDEWVLANGKHVRLEKGRNENI